MRSYASVALTACLLTNVFASKNFIAGYSVLRAEDVLARPYSELMGPRASTPLIVGRGASVVNAAAGPAEGVMLNNNGTLNVTAWNVATNDACIKALQPLSRSTNPSGNCICYNLPSLDTKTGIFEADLRLYRISQPRDNFANIPPENVKVGLEYHGASVSPISANDLMGMGQANRTSKLVARDAGNTPRLVQTYMFVGQIDQTKLKDNMSMAALEEVLIPTFTLTATNSTGGNVQTNVSLNEASFLTGIFSKSVVMSDFSAARAAVNSELDALHNGTVAFILPGTQILIFPIGAIITSIWLALGLVAYGYGTFQRINYAEAYKRRMTERAPRKAAF